MDFELTDDQEALAGLVRAIVSGRFDLERVRRREGQPEVIDGDGWAALGEAGVFSLTIPEAAGGVGLGMADAAVVFEELGRGLVPGPLVASHLAARLGAEALDGGAHPEVGARLGGAADGSLVVGSVMLPDAARGDEPIVLIEHLGSLGALIVVGPGPSLSLVTPIGGTGTAIERSLDPLTPLYRVSGDVRDDGSGDGSGDDVGDSDSGGGDWLGGGTPIGDTDTARRWIRDAQVLTGALCVGIATATCDMAVEYARGRQQFGRPIGSFQAVKHLCADMLARAETARAGVQAAAVTIDQPDVGDADRAAAGAALLATDAAILNSRTCIQIHGGMGFTWEVPAHLYLMRAKVLASSIGPADRLAAIVTARY